VLDSGFLKNLRDKESSVAMYMFWLRDERVADLESPGWGALIPKSSKINRLPQTTTFQTLFFHNAVT